ncbi:hypothetical protein [Mesorhizobium qingshengii]|uniref:Uncharacterized protein n=1 Tax=Mesorhizobium qingshengii TaxID=1165689 RepID=A0A1G5ZYP9_9HYPH|nr:hypothetical protein [Mesorhizobium qingshengii]SDA99353.1 hypothetical protein SAMN02927914_06548 [Mesorhizobium qingshengii]
MIKPSSFSRFESSYLKVERSKIHAEQFKSSIAEFFATNPYRAVIDPNSTNASKQLIIEQIEPTPKTLPLIIGDVIHNLRSALDHLASDLVLFKKASLDSVYFPTGVDKDGYHNALTKPIRKAGLDAIKRLAKVEAYYGGNGAIIRALHDLDVADKHRAIVPTLNRALVTNIRAVGGGYDLFFAGITLPVVNGRASLLKDYVGVDIQFDEAKPLDVSFGEPPLIASESIGETLEKMTKAVVAIIDSFANDPTYS